MTAAARNANSDLNHDHSLHTLVSNAAFHAQEDGSLKWNREGLGRLRREMIWTLGPAITQGIFTRAGLSCGRADELRNPLAEPTVVGWGTVLRSHISDDGEEFTFEFETTMESNEHLLLNPLATAPQCWFLTGYLSGAVSQRYGRPLYTVETECRATGGTVCRFVARLRESWETDGNDLTLYTENNVYQDLQETREQLQLTKDRYQNLFEQSPSAMVIVNPDSGQLLNINLAAEELTGHSREQLLRMNIFDLYHPQEHHRLMAEIKTLLTGRRSLETEFSLVRRDTLLRTIVQSSSVLTYGGQRVMQATIRDVTDLKMSTQKEKDLQHQLTRSERLSTVGRLAASVAHELKNPLGAIRNAIYYIRNAVAKTTLFETDPHLKDMIKLAEGEVDGSVVIIGELLDFSRVVAINPRRTSVNELLERLPAIVMIPENVKMEWDLDVALPSAVVDPDRLSQVFCNITGNAIQAMPQGGRLMVRSRLVMESSDDGSGQSRLIVQIEDTGMGIDPMHLTKIFEPLFTTKARGTGLGLAISSNIVEKHGGVILVASQLGKGTSFTIKLPLQPSEHEEGGDKS